MPSTLSTSLESRTPRERMLLGDGEFEITNSILERHGFLDEEQCDETDQEVGRPSLAAVDHNSSSTLTVGHRRGWDGAGEIKFLTDREGKIVQTVQRASHEI